MLVLKKILKALGILTAIAAVLLGLVSAFFYIVAFKRKVPELFNRLLFGGMGESEDDKKRNALTKETEEFLSGMKLTELTISAEDGLKLYGKLLMAEEHKGTAILMHGFHGFPEGDFAGLIRHYHEIGFNVLMIHDRGLGKSEGKWLGFSWLDRRDLVLWAKYITGLFGDDERSFLHGVSMGGAGVMMASGEEDLPASVKGIIDDCGFTSTLDEFRHVFPDKFSFLREPVLFIDSVASRIFRGYFFKEASSLDQLKKNTRPILFIHGGADDFVPTEMVYRCYDAAVSEKELLVVPGAGHAVSYVHSPEMYEEAVDSFIEKYVI